MATFSASELQARYITARQGPTYRVGADLITFKAVATETAGAYSLFEVCTEPGQGIPLHFQRYEDETFWVLEGTYTLMIGGRSLVMTTGDYAFVPRGSVHAFTNSGQTAARTLIMLSPGGIHERFFTEVGQPLIHGVPQPITHIPLDFPSLRIIAQKYGIEFL